jgi:DNA recombination protein RmuC
METLLVVVLAALSGAALAAAYVSRVRPGLEDRDLRAVREEVRLLAERLGSDSEHVRSRLEGIDGRMLQTQVASQDLAGDIFEVLGDVRRATTTVAEQAREFSALQDLLRAPKARGGLGEAMLEQLLREVLPAHSFEMQHRFRTGAVVDAIVRLDGRLVCIDSKFPLSNYRRMCEAKDDAERLSAERDFSADVERHVRDIASRYILPDEGTFDFAVMYVPAEGVYAEVLRLSHRKRPLYESALEARVVPMSPLTMFGYLQTVLFGLKCLNIEERAEAILGFCGRLEADLGRFATEYETLGRHLANARSKYEEGTRRLDRFRDKLEHVVDLAGDENPRLEDDDRPSLEAVGEPQSTRDDYLSGHSTQVS